MSFTSSLRRRAQKVLNIHAEVGRMRYARFTYIAFAGPLLLLDVPSFAHEPFPLSCPRPGYAISIGVECPWLRWEGL